jgi:hypothetical protein
MKTNTNKNQKNTKSGLLIRPEQSSTESKPKSDRPKIDLALRRVNRQLETEKLLALLQTNAPRLYELAEVVGKWVWIQFSNKQPSDVTRVLAELGFHWNNRRQSWQHPCGTIPERADYDPRERYGSHFAADQQAA